MISDPDRSDTAEPLNRDDGSRVAPDPELTSPTIGATNVETALQNVGAERDANLPGVLPLKTPPLVLPAVDVADLDWIALRDRLDIGGVRSRMAGIVSRMEHLLDQTTGAAMLFDSDRKWPGDRTINVSQIDENALWFIGDLHGDLLALEAALILIRTHIQYGFAKSRIVFLGDLFDGEGFGLEVVLRVFEVVLENPALVCIVAGNHDEALGFDGTRFTSSVSPSDFSDVLNDSAGDEWATRTGKLAIRLFATAPRALFFPDGLLAAHGGFPLIDLHPQLLHTGDWNDPACLSDFVWTRAHPTARKKLPNRYSRGSQFGFEDFAAFCSLAARLGRPVTHMVRGHDHVEQRFAIYPAYSSNPILTTVALSRRLSREFLGPYERQPTVARYVPGRLPQVFRMQMPAGLIREIYPESLEDDDTQLESTTGVA
jgi:calcineurin-like phosphoesterase family protein